MGEIRIDDYTAKEAMELAIKYMKLESVQTIEIVTLDTLKYYNDKEKYDTYDNIKWKQEAFNIVLAEDSAVLKSAGIDEERLLDERLLKEADSYLFVKMFMRFLHKNRAKVFLLAENESVLKQMKSFIEIYSSGIKIIDSVIYDAENVSDDMILNRINGAEIDCVMATLSPPYQQEFVIKNRLLVNARIWIGLGTHLGRRSKKGFVYSKVIQIWNRYIKRKTMI